ncbi:MAG: thioredoxin family protein [Bacilli bacterium]|nr:thioredoxin family protein [Bacilli bacterium]MDD4624683.1 thioredoxin family protein [Bacilli bacterium]MDD4831792.1 thioredoxin family protein [Bacilli bacterium]
MKIIKIGALWCPGCLILNNNLKKIKENYKDIEIIEYDYDFDLEVKKFKVGNILPVLIFMNDDNEISRLIGEKSYKEIINEIERISNV